MQYLDWGSYNGYMVPVKQPFLVFSAKGCRVRHLGSRWFIPTGTSRHSLCGSVLVEYVDMEEGHDKPFCKRCAVVLKSFYHENVLLLSTNYRRPS